MGHPVLEWYHKLDSRIVDLVGDFAGDELFIVEGDSLLLQCFANPKLDFNPGLQLLHATYLVEQEIAKLRQRRCNFEIVFFAQNAQCCIPAGIDSELQERYLLAREAITQHLFSIQEQVSESFRVLRFESPQSEEFSAHLTNSGSYLLMCHDGAFTNRSEEDGSEPENSDSESSDSDEDDSELEDGDSDSDSDASSLPTRTETSKYKLRAMIRWFSDRGYNIALINSLEFRDTKVMAMVIEGSATQPQNRLELDNSQTDGLESAQVGLGLDGLNEALSELSLNKKVSLSQKQLEELLERAITDQPTMTQRQCLLTVALSAMFSGGVAENPESKTGAQAMLLHLALLQEIQLSDRGIKSQDHGDSPFFEGFLKTLRVLLSSSTWENVTKNHSLLCDVSDLLDGNLFFAVHKMLETSGVEKVLTSATSSSYNTLASTVDRLCGTTLQSTTLKTEASTTGAPSGPTKDKKKSPSLKVLPFSNPVFDEHLKPVHLTIDESLDPKNAKNAREFKEEIHWHNTKPLESKGKVILTPKELHRARRRAQFFMSEMETYAQSLTGSTGATHPETIIVGPTPSSNDKSHQKSGSKNHQADSNKPTNKKTKAQAKSGKQDVRGIAAASIQQKAAESTQKQRQKWKTMYQEEFTRIADLETRFIRLGIYVSSLSKDSRRIVEGEVLMCMIDTLVRLVFFERETMQTERLIFLATRVWELIARLSKLKEGVSSPIVSYVEKVCQLFKLPSVQLVAQCDDALSFQPFNIPSGQNKSIKTSPVDFQLFHGGHCMERSIDSLPDPRTPDFDPDRWQRQVLDQIDLKKSVFIVAPTSAGKTFISFYAMRQVLKEDDDGILVYVAPTKALVNQIAAEVLARFSKRYPDKVTGKSVWAIHTRDTRINEPKGCQILITVPHILQTMLLAPTNAKAWTPRIRRIIYDEIHCIGQAEDGVVWEQLLLLSPCPIVALSATVGNPQKFYDWLHLAQKANGLDLEMIQHQHRYSDLRKYIYKPPKEFSFKGFPPRVGLPRVGLDEAQGMELIHPVISIVDRSRSMPNDLDFEPRDCLTLWKAMNDLQTEQFPVDASLDPSVVFAGKVIKKIDVFEWQKQLKSLLGVWMKDHSSPFDELSRRLAPKTSPEEVQVSSDAVSKPGETEDVAVSGDLLSTTLPLVFSLHAQGALPALFFNYDRNCCEELCIGLLNQLRDAEAEWKAESPKWKLKMAKWEEWKTNQTAAKKKSAKVTKKKGGNDEDGPGSREDQMKDSASLEGGQFDRFDPERPLDEFNLADAKKVGPEEFEGYAEELRYRSVPQPLIDALERGVGVHHAGMNRKYRYVCEMLFRRGFLRVVFATGTLALGINMPCKTVVFAGDSIFLTALNFRQAAGRAGRRGFDLLGNVVFHQVPPSKMHRLISSKLPDLNGHFPITTTLILRLFSLLQGSNKAPSAVKSINSLLSSPRIYLGGPAMKETVLHHLRFSIEYLRRNSLLDIKGVPLNFAGCVSHLYFTENSSFAFHALLTSGYLQKLCKDIRSKPIATVKTLMLVMTHVFSRLPLRSSVLEHHHNAEKKPSSIVALPPMPSKAVKALADHNTKVLNIYTAYVSSFVEQHVKTPDCQLPFSGLKCGGESSPAQLGFSEFKPVSPKVVSPFFALSGNDDKCKTISDLCEMVRSGVWLEESVIPFVAASKAENPVPLNAYLYDFFKHGNVSQLEYANRIRRGDVWFLLNDFSMILATINASLDIFLDPKGNGSGEMLDVTGGGEAHETQQEMHDVDVEIETKEQANTKSGGKVPVREEFVPVAPKPAPNLRKQKPVDSWEDEMDDEDSEPEEWDDGESSKQQKEEPVDKSHESMALVSEAFKELQRQFDEKFRAMWA